MNLRAYLDLAALVTSLPIGDRERLSTELAACDLEPELDTLLHLLSDLFPDFSPPISDFNPPIDSPPAMDRQALETLGATVRRRLLAIDSYRESEAFAEVAVRRWHSRLGYAWRVLFPSRLSARALRELQPPKASTARRSAGSRTAFLGQRIKGRRKAAPRRHTEEEISIKRQVYLRR